MIDNHDSFTYNLVALLTEVAGARPVVVTNDSSWESIDFGAFDNVVISPGPGRPERARDFGISARVVAETDLPLLGVCLGHQGLCHTYGAAVDLATTPMHGRVSRVEHDGRDLFRGLPSPFSVTRYHSLVVGEVPDELEVTAHAEDGAVMAVRHRSLPRWGVQFHPESIASQHGRALLANFRDLSARARGAAVGVSGQVPGTPAPAPVQPQQQPQPADGAPEWRRIDCEVDPEAVFAQLFAGSAHAVWLDRVAAESGSRVSVLADSTGPLAEVLAYDVDGGRMRVDRGGTVTEHTGVDLFDHLATRLGERRVAPSDEIPFALGYVGFLGYELGALTLGHATTTRTHGRDAPGEHIPDAALVFVDRAVVIDHDRACTYVLRLAPGDAAPAGDTDWLDDTVTLIRTLPERVPAGAPRPIVADVTTPLTLRHDRDGYLGRIASAQEAIRQGESYELCLTNMAHVQAQVDPLATFVRLRASSPAPYSAYLLLGDVAVASASPERFLRVTADGTVDSKPIKGTRPRGATQSEDASLRAELRASEKERAENLMIVDLTRNDLTRVCDPLSVHVPELFAVETYSSVHQLVSTIRGRLRPDCTAVDAVRAAFPGGSMTGAPKKRTTEIIAELEQGRRGVYSGSIGYFALDGSADLSIVIRSLVCTPDGVSFGIGGAVTALSDPAAEFDETLVKAAGLLHVLANDTAADHTDTGAACPDPSERRTA
nr:aminodeoxychorismate synthase component I [Rhodococcus sp. HNM0569]